MQIDLSKDGQPVLLTNGAFTTAVESPFEEANRWILRNQKIIEQSSSIILLGLGSGYHAQRLVEFANLKRIHIVDDRKDAINFFFKYHQFDQRFKFYCLKNKKEVKADAGFRQVLLRPYKLLSFFPATRHNSALYAWLKEVLLGRTPNALRELIELRGDFKMLRSSSFRLIEGSMTERAQVPKSIKDLAPILNSELELSSTQRNALKLLMELIK